MDTAKIKIRWKYYQYFILLIFHLNKLSVCNETSTEVSYSVSSSSSTKVEIGGHIITSNTNETREALSHDASQHDSVVFISDTSGYVPIPSIGRRGHGRPPPTPPSSSEEEFDYRQPPWDKDAWNRDTWDREYRKFRFNNTRVQQIDAICQDDYMQIRVGFNNSFTGMIYSAGYAYDPDCMYVNGTGRDYYEFAIELNRCGTLGKNLHHDDRRQPSKNFMWNTITVQYNPLIEEEFDEHFKVTCEYGYDYWKTVTFPFLDVEVATGNPVIFTLQPPECYMEILYGYGTDGTRVTGAVRVGDPLTLVINMRTKYEGFDIIVNNCIAHNGATKRIHLIDEDGCPVDDKLISKFKGQWLETGMYETKIFAFMKTFRFTGSPTLYIECGVRMCQGRCPVTACYWRNNKVVSKRSVEEKNQTIPQEGSVVASTTVSTTTPISENVNLFQSLRVLQEGEADEARNTSDVSAFKELPRADPGSVCLKTGWFSALLALGGGAMCLLGGALLATCSRLRKSAIDRALAAPPAFNGYMPHKGRIN